MLKIIRIFCTLNSNLLATECSVIALLFASYRTNVLDHAWKLKFQCYGRGIYIYIYAMPSLILLCTLQIMKNKLFLNFTTFIPTLDTKSQKGYFDLSEARGRMYFWSLLTLSQYSLISTFATGFTTSESWTSGSRLRKSVFNENACFVPRIRDSTSENINEKHKHSYS